MIQEKFIQILMVKMQKIAKYFHINENFNKLLSMTHQMLTLWKILWKFIENA